MDKVSSNQELLELRRNGKITEDEYKQLLGAMSKSLPNDSQKKIKNNKKYMPWIGLGMVLIAVGVLVAIAAFDGNKGEDASVAEEEVTQELVTERSEYVSIPSKKIEGRIVDKIDYPFVNDPAAIGTWVSVDFVKEIDDFDVDEATWYGDLYLKKMVLFEAGGTAGPWRWTKGLIIHPGDKTAAKYHIKEMDGERYMFFEWKSGDYTIRGKRPAYYVLRKKALETAKSN